MTSLSPPLVSVLELFKGPLGRVRFADIDAAGLAHAAEEVEAAALEVQAQEAKLAELRQGLAQRQESLLVLAQQALAYARVYAEQDAALREELNRISLPRAAKPRKSSTGKAAAEPAAEPAAKAKAAAEPEAPSTESDAEADAGGPRRPGRKARGSVPERASNSSN